MTFDLDFWYSVSTSKIKVIDQGHAHEENKSSAAAENHGWKAETPRHRLTLTADI